MNRTVRTLIADNFIYYVSILAPIIGYMLLFGLFFANNDAGALTTSLDKALFYSKFFWFTGFLVVLANVFGLLIYGSPLRKELADSEAYKATGWNKQKRLIVTYVSRGDNFQALERSIAESAAVLDRLAVDYQIDVVTDIAVAHKVENRLNTHFHVVPGEFTTNKSTKYKARALHYMVEVRKQPDHHSANHPDVWILHLDEESTVTESAVYGILEFISNPANTNKIGQGEIKYNAHKYASDLLIAATDSIRTGDDLGRFRFQYKLTKRPVFGMHGSYVLVPQSIERQIGFDLSPKQSITDDAYFAFKAADRGIRFGWVNGYIREQSPFTVGDIMKQRRRWFNGLMFLAFDNEITLKTRFFLMVNMFLWTVAWLGPIVTVINLIAGGGYFPTELALAAAFLQGGYAAIYQIGVYRNMQDTDFSFLKKLSIYLATFILTPFANLIEGLSVLYAITIPVKGFHVVQKN